LLKLTTPSIKDQFLSNKISWENSFKFGLSQDENGNFVPWFCYDAISFLQEKLEKNWRIFEFGSGASTLFFLQQNVRFLASVESNSLWHQFLQQQILQQNIKPNKANYRSLLITDALNNLNYPFLPYQFCKKEKFNLIIIDSLKREKTILASIEAIKPSGIIILDDSQRKNYQKIFSLMEKNNFMAINFTGIAPAGLKNKQTTFFIKKND